MSVKQKRRNWTRDELIVAFNLYCKIEFSKIHYSHHLIKKLAKAINRTPSAVAWKLVNFASLDPSLAQRGIKGARNIGKLDKIIFDEFINNWDKFIYESEMLLKNYFNEKVDVQREKEKLESLEGTEKNRVVKTRVNQSFFRDMILSSYDFKCCITGINQKELLVASHIIPWSKDEKNRLNPQNGICLNNLHDKAFDRGLISFNSDYRLIVSNELKQNKSPSIDLYFTNIEGLKIMLPKRFLPNNDFLKYHYNNIFKK